MEENNKLDSIENSIQTIQNDIVLLKKNDSLQDEKIEKLENKQEDYMESQYNMRVDISTMKKDIKNTLDIVQDINSNLKAQQAKRDSETEDIRKEQKLMQNEINELKTSKFKDDSEMFQKVKWVIISGIISAVLAVILTMIGLKK